MREQHLPTAGHVPTIKNAGTGINTVQIDPRQFARLRAQQAAPAVMDVFTSADFFAAQDDSLIIEPIAQTPVEENGPTHRTVDEVTTRNLGRVTIILSNRKN